MAANARFWAFSLAIYSRPKVPEACLRLQDSRGLDVNLLLHALWCGALGHRITLAERQSLDAIAAPWQGHAVRPLREVRRWLKSQDRLSKQEAEPLRDQVKALELEAERLEQLLLERHLSPPEAAGGPAHAAANLHALVPQPNEQERADLVVLLRSAWPQAEPQTLHTLLSGRREEGQ